MPLGEFFQEVNSILQQVVERNRVRRSLSAKRHALQSWRSLVETLLTACPADLIAADDRQLIIRDLLLDLHDKVSEDKCHLPGKTNATMISVRILNMVLDCNLLKGLVSMI